MVLKNVLVENIVNNKDQNPTVKLEYIKSTWIVAFTLKRYIDKTIVNSIAIEVEYTCWNRVPWHNISTSGDDKIMHKIEKISDFH